MYSTVLILRSIIYGAVGKGAQVESLCEAIGITPADLHDPERKIEGMDAIVKLWQKVIEQTKDEAIGLHLGADHNLSILGLIGYVIHNCPTYKDAWLVLQQNQRMLSGWVSYDMQVEKNDVRLTYSIDPVWSNASPQTAWQAAEVAMAGFFNSTRILTGKAAVPKRVELVRPRPATASEYERIFDSSVKFSMPANVIVCGPELLKKPILSADRSLYATFNQLLQAKSAELADSITFVEQVKRTIMSDFKSVVPAVDAIASHMNMSSRSFQRKLEGEGKSYREISEEIKKELTLALLRNPKYNANEISRALGYAEPAAFRLAFKRWMDETPAQWRKKNLTAER